MAKHFQKIHSDELKAAVVEIALRQGTSGAALGRMIRAGQVPGFPDAAHINDQTVRDWINQAKWDAETASLNQMQRLAQEVFNVAQQEIREIKRRSNPNRPANAGERVQPDPAQLRKLLETAAAAWKVIHPPPAPSSPSGTGGDPVEPTALSDADREVASALADGQSAGHSAQAPPEHS
jgi:predicted RNA-binding Zn ribbon-like protein